MRCELHECLKPEKKDKCDNQTKLAEVKLCLKKLPHICSFKGEYPLGKMEPEDWLFP